MREPRVRAQWARIPVITLAAAALLGLPACWNGAFQSNVDKSKGGKPRFELVVEPKRSDVDASHFLVDSTTGDTWLLETTGAKAGRWVRLADGPADAADPNRGKRKKNKKKKRKNDDAPQSEVTS